LALLSSKALRNWKIFVSVLSKRLLVITVITKRLIAVIIVILTIIITIINRYFRYITKLTSFNRYFRYITKITSFWPVTISLTANETIITVIFAIKISNTSFILYISGLQPFFLRGPLKAKRISTDPQCVINWSMNLCKRGMKCYNTLLCGASPRTPLIHRHSIKKICSISGVHTSSPMAGQKKFNDQNMFFIQKVCFLWKNWNFGLCGPD
jgi:hypothetical protein